MAKSVVDSFKNVFVGSQTRFLLFLLLRGVTQIMATLVEVNAKLDQIATGVDGLETAIAELKAQVAAGHVVSQEELDALGAKAAAIFADIQDTSDQG